MHARARALGLGEQSADHGVNRSKLGTRFHRVVGTRITEPVPAALRIERDRGRIHLRIQNEDAVRVGPVVVVGLLIEIVANHGRRLLASMERDVNLALRSLIARLRHVDGFCRAKAAEVVFEADEYALADR